MIPQSSVIQLIFYLAILLILVKPLGWYIAQVYQGKSWRLTQPLETFITYVYRICGIDATEEMDWKRYLCCMLLFNLCGFVAVFVIQLLQTFLPLNPQHLVAPSTDLAFNVAASFVTNTNWQPYSGETTFSYLTQMLALTSQNFLSAATGMSLLIAFIRGIVQREGQTLGNFWVDTTRGILYILLPLSLLMAVVLVSQGVIQTFLPNQTFSVMESSYSAKTTSQATTSTPHTQQVIPMGPVASQIAIKQLGSNGGGFFNANAAHPFENPTPLSNFLEMIALLLIPAALCYTFGLMVRDTRQGWVILLAMLMIFIPFLLVANVAEQTGNPQLTPMGVLQDAQPNNFPGGNLEGKETRLGIVNSAIWATGTTASSNGSANANLDSFTPLGGLVPLWMMQMGEVIFGGVGTGLYGMLMLVIITVFVAGLMVGRTPEYLGKKIEPHEMKMASIAVLIMPFIVLVSTACAVVLPDGVSAIGNPGAHGFSEILYAFTSMGNNNGSAFSGLNANAPFYNILGGLIMLMARYGVAIPVLAIAGSLVQKKIIPNNAGTLATHTPLFVILLICVTLLLGALSFLPALALGPIVEHLMLGVTHAL